MKASSSNDGVSTGGGSKADASLERLGNKSSIALEEENKRLIVTIN